MGKKSRARFTYLFAIVANFKRLKFFQNFANIVEKFREMFPPSGIIKFENYAILLQ